jgi:glycine/D-amino acid oxidase-like deaminating enzyme
MQTCDVAVIGAGIVGAACAYELSLAGLRVVMVEPNAVGSGATNLGYGSLSVQDETPGQLALTRYGLALWERLVEWLPRECEYRRCGTVWVAVEEGDLEAAALRGEFFNRQGVPAEVLDSQQLTEAEPGLNHKAAGGLLVSGDGCLRASRAAEFLFQLASQKGIQHVPQRALSFQNHELRLADGSVLYAGNVVNAAGNEAPSLTPELPLTYSKGHLLVVETRAHCASHQISAIAMEAPPEIEGRARFELRQSAAAPNEASEVWIGSSAQLVNGQAASTQVEAKMVAHLLRRAIEMVSAIGSAKPLRSWTGVRATCADGLPLIGRVAGRENTFVATGHGGYGATAALATARLLVDELLCQTPEIDAMPYRADRFEGTKLNYAK